MTVKVGTRVLTDKQNKIDRSVIKEISSQVSSLMDRGIEVIVVSSGAIGSGLGILKLQKKPKSLSQLQAIAAVGQNHLMDIYNEHLGRNGYVAGQILITQEDFNDRKRYLNIKYTLDTLLSYKAIPIINENDSVSTAEIKCGDNDRISSLVADLSGSDTLVILSDVDGLCGENGEVIAEVEEVNAKVMGLCRGKGSEVSTGGMATKLEAVRHATRAGIRCFIARGKRENVLVDIADGKHIGTRFAASGKTLAARKRWIAFGLKPRGRIIIDDGASKALAVRNKSLLPSGVVGVEGEFECGDVVEVASQERKVLARGLTNYSSGEILKIMGKRTDRIEAELGYKDYDEVIHRDNLVVIE